MMRDPRIGDPKMKSPAEKTMVDGSDWRPERPGLSPEGFVQEKRPIRVIRRSLSPPGLERAGRIMDGGPERTGRIMDGAPERTGRILDGYQQGDSFERPEYDRRIYHTRDDGDPSMERPEYDRRIYRSRDGSDPTIERPEYDRRVYHIRDDSGIPRSPSCRPSLKWPDMDEEFLLKEGPPLRDRRDNYTLTEYRDSYGELNPNLKHFGGSGSSSSQYNHERHFQGSDRSSLMPPQMMRTLNSGRGGGTLPASSSGNPKLIHREDEEIQYQNNLYSDKISGREYFKGEDKRVLYSEDVYDPTLVSSHSKDFVSLPSGGSKENYLAFSQENMHSYGYGRRQGKYMGIEGQDGYNESPSPDFARDPELRSNDASYYPYEPVTSARGKHQEYNYHEHGRREEINPRYRSGLYRHDQPNDREDYSSRDALRPGLSRSVVEEVQYIERSRKNLRESNSHSHHSLQRKPLSNYRDMGSNLHEADRDEACFGSGNINFGMKLSSPCKRINPGRDFGFGRDAGPLSHKERLKRLHMTECDPNFHQHNVSPPRRLKAKELSIYETTERMLKRRYLIDEEINRRDDRSVALGDRITSRQVHELNHSEEQWTDENPVGTFSSKRPRFGHVLYRKAGRPDERIERHISAADDWTSSHDVPRHVQRSTIDGFTTGDGHTSIKGRLKPSPSNHHDSYPMDKRQDFDESDRSGKRYLDNQCGDMFTDDVNQLEDMDTSVKSDLPENSDEFKQLVENLFLQFSKRLNENPSTQRRYREQGNAGTLLCVVCGRLSKEFQDTRRLVTHTFMCRKVGKRAHHLALNKAICVLMGWKSIVTPTGACVYEDLPPNEALALKEDLILWHPLVIIHNSLIVGDDSDGKHIVHIEKMEAILRGLGFSGGKIKVRYGKPVNHSILLVRFMPTFPGLQEAEKLHKYFLENKRGRMDYLEQKFNRRFRNSEEAGEIVEEKVEQTLYGYLGIAEDLDKLDLDTKKRSLVKSKKDIQAIEDALLKSE